MSSFFDSSKPESVHRPVIANKEFSDGDWFLKEATEVDAVNRPPKEWWDKMQSEVKQGNPSYSQEQVDKTIGDIWHNKLSDYRKEKVTKRSEGVKRTAGLKRKAVDLERFRMRDVKNEKTTPYLMDLKIRHEVDPESQMEVDPENYKGLSQEEIDTYVAQDQSRAESQGVDWEYLFIDAIATIGMPRGQGSVKMTKIESGGVGGVDSDSGDSELSAIDDEQLYELKGDLESMNVDLSNWDELVAKAKSNIVTGSKK